jgi:hypothetical protein
MKCSRDDRARKADKESLEKSRLVERREKFTRYENQGPPTVPAPNALGYMTDANRFHSDTAGEEKEARNDMSFLCFPCDSSCRCGRRLWRASARLSNSSAKRIYKERNAAGLRWSAQR